jgi:hypothetical protein
MITSKMFLELLLRLFDVVLVPFVFLSALLLKFVRIAGVKRLPCCKWTLLKVGVFPIRNHYYEPLFDAKMLHRPLSADRSLPGIDWNVNGQLKLINQFHYAKELISLWSQKNTGLAFDINNVNFGSGDAEYWYSIIRFMKPKRITEIGSGNSTLVALTAIRQNTLESPEYVCRHTCIEPFEMPWLERTGVNVIREKVENLDRNNFSDLEENDILFIDSSHIIRPQGDVLFEYLELLPSLKKGVIVHIHDIFSPRDYLQKWIQKDIKFWNEQYLLEAFLTSNTSWRIIGALNHLHHHHYDSLNSICPYLTHEREPGSFYIQKIA